MGMIGRRGFLQGTALGALGAVVGPARAHLRPFQVVIAGGGFAGAACALQLRRLAPEISVTLIDPFERYVTCPMSNQALVDLRSLESLTVTRDGLARAGVRHVRARMSGFDSDRRRVVLDDGSSLNYHRLVVAPGIRFLWGTPQGYDEAAAQHMPHAWKAGSQTDLLTGQLRAMPNGGVVAISVPTGLMRCPPAPYERASLIAHYLKTRKPRSKVLIFDANNQFPKQDVFSDVWAKLYPGMIEWIPVVQGGAVVRVDVQKSTLYTSQATHSVNVANIIPPQAPGQLALDMGLCSGHGWCPVYPESFESLLIKNVHVIGDACIASPMPKSASAAVSQARQCAGAIVAAMQEREPPTPAFDSVCYSLLAPDRVLAMHGRFQVANGAIQSLPAQSGDAANKDSASVSETEAWYKNIVTQAFG